MKIDPSMQPKGKDRECFANAPNPGDKQFYYCSGVYERFAEKYLSTHPELYGSD